MMAFSIPSPFWPVALAAGLIIIASTGGLLWRLERLRSHRLGRFADAGLLQRLVLGYRPQWRLPVNALVLAGVALLLLSIAGPRWGLVEVEGLRGNREILVLLDTSESMNAVNPPPSRIERARDKVIALLDQYSADRFGLIAFSGAAALECPLTEDLAYFKTVLQAVGTDTLTAEGTDIEAAIIEAEKLFEHERGRGHGATALDRIVLLISDGEEVSGDAVEAAGRLAAHGRVVVLGIGDPEGAEVTLPQWMQRSRYTPRNAGPHWSALDEEKLAAIALAGNGVYVRSTLSADDLGVIGHELALLDGAGRAGDPSIAQVNRYRWPLAAAMACFFAEGLWLVLLPRLARTRRRSVEKEGDHAVA